MLVTVGLEFAKNVESEDDRWRMKESVEIVLVLLVVMSCYKGNFQFEICSKE